MKSTGCGPRGRHRRPGAFRASALGFAIAGAIWIAESGPIRARQSDRARSANATTSAAHRARGLQLTYNLDYDDAREAYRQAIAADPSGPAAYRQLAAVNWLNILFRNGAVLVDDYLGEAKQTVKRGPPPSDLAAQFRENIGKALALAEPQLRDHPTDADAHYQVGATLGVMASYSATVEGKVLGAFRSARRAYGEHERVLELEPARKDAGLIVGTYRYGVSALPIHWRLLAQLAGFGGGRDPGLRLVEDAASYPADARPEARFVLIVMYSREGHYDEALRVIAQLQADYPKNRLLWLEAGSTALRAGRPDVARRELEAGLAKLSADRRPRAYGEDARWHVSYASALVALRETEAARRELGSALAADAPGWVYGRAHVGLGKVADVTGDRRAALDEYRRASEVCRTADDSTCTVEAKRLIATPYR